MNLERYLLKWKLKGKKKTWDEMTVAEKIEFVNQTMFEKDKEKEGGEEK